MKPPTFQKSKDETLEFVADMIGVSSEQLTARSAA